MRLASEPGHRFPFGQLMTAAILLIIAGSPLSAVGERCDAVDKGSDGMRIRIDETSRSLSLLPLVNETGEERLNYLGLGIPKMIRKYFEDIGTISVDDARMRFYAATGTQSDKNSDGGPFRLDLDIRLIEQSDLLEKSRRKSPAARAAVLGSEYLITGSFRGSSSGSIELNLELYDAVRNNTIAKSYSFPSTDVYERMETVGLDFQNYFKKEGTVELTVITPEDGALVYLDDTYMGKTPLKKKIFPGEYLLQVEQREREPYAACERIDASRINEYKIETPSIVNRGALRITGEPEGAEIYLDMTRIGTIPLFRDDLPEGTHRLRISREGFIDRFIGVRLDRKQTRHVDVRMVAGDTFSHFRNPHFAVLDWSYHDLSFYSLLSSLAFYGGYFVLKQESGRISNSIRNEIPAYSIIDLPSLSAYQIYRLEQNRALSVEKMEQANLSARAGGISVLLAGIFLWRGIVLDNFETGEVSHGAGTDLFAGCYREERGGSAVAGIRYRY